jgi:hypothetical protein
LTPPPEIGSFFYWKASRKYVTLFHDITHPSLPSPVPDQDLFFILDVQQRVTSIWATFQVVSVNGDNYGSELKLSSRTVQPRA